MSFSRKISSAFQFNERHLFYITLSLILGFIFYRRSTCFPLNIDELGSWGVSTGTNQDVLRKSIFSQGQGPIYFLVLSNWMKLFGDSFLSIRGLSYILSTLNLVVVSKIGELLFSKNYSKYLVVLYVISPFYFNYETQARPYVVANLLLSLIIYFTIKYAKSSKTFYLIPTSILIPLIFYTHYLYCLSIPVLLVFVWFFSLEKKVVTLKYIFVNVTTSILALLPTLEILQKKVNNLEKLAYTLSPTLEIFFYFLILSTIGLTLLSKLIIAYSIRIEGSNKLYKPLIIIGILGTLIVYTSLFLLSTVQNAPLFSFRYFSASLLYSSIAACAIILSHPRSRNLIFLITSIFLFFSHVSFFDSHLCTKEDAYWSKDLSNFLFQHKNNCQIYASSTFIEAQTPSYLSDPNYEEFLKSPVSYYYKDSIKLLPMSLSNESMRGYFNNSILPDIRSNNCVIILANRRELRSDAFSFIPLSRTLEKVLSNADFNVVKVKELDTMHFLIFIAQK